MRIDKPPDDDGLAPVITLRPGQDIEDDARPLATADRPKKFCTHNRCELVGDTRRVYCRDCGREVPAFDVLLQLTRSHERFIEQRREAERRTKVARGHLEDLLRDERNAKARRRSWRRQEPEAMRHLRALIGLCAQLAGRGHPTVAAAEAFVVGEVELHEADTADCS